MMLYIDNIQAKAGKGPDDFRQMAAERGYLRDGIRNAETEIGRSR
jgi:hypothetical protein